MQGTKTLTDISVHSWFWKGTFFTAAWYGGAEDEPVSPKQGHRRYEREQLCF
jgi:hypothetical protein